MQNNTLKIQQLRNRLEQLEVRAKEADRKARTRRLILWGSLVEEMIQNDSEFAATMRQRADKNFMRKVDREALGLPVVIIQTASPSTSDTIAG